MIQDLYKRLDTTNAHSEQAMETFQQELISPTYGEMAFESIYKLATRINLSEQDVLMDLGSGYGKFALSLPLMSLCQVIGVEAQQKMHTLALQKRGELEQVLEEPLASQVQFEHANFLESDFDRATILYSCSTCYSYSLLWALGKKINASKVPMVLSLKPIPSLERLTCRGSFSVECSWDSALCYVYQ